MMGTLHGGDVVGSTGVDSVDADAARGHASGWKLVAMVDRETAHKSTADFAMGPGRSPADGALVGRLASPTY